MKAAWEECCKHNRVKEGASLAAFIVKLVLLSQRPPMNGIVIFMRPVKSRCVSDTISNSFLCPYSCPPPSWRSRCLSQVLTNKETTANHLDLSTFPKIPTLLGGAVIEPELTVRPPSGFSHHLTISAENVTINEHENKFLMFLSWALGDAYPISSCKEYQVRKSPFQLFCSSRHVFKAWRKIIKYV